MRYLKTGLVIILAVYAVMVLGYQIWGTLDENGSKDFHAFWYAGQFILEGIDPYQALFSDMQLPMRQPGLEIRPSNSAPMLLVLTLFSLLPWLQAKLAWLVVNLLLAFLCFYLVEHYMPFPGLSLDRPARILIFLIFFDLSPTRIAIENGQTTLLVFALMLMAVLMAKRSWLLAGCLLGLALSKISVSVLVVLFFLYHRNYRVLATAIVFQLLGFAGIAFLSGNPIVQVLSEYLRLFISLSDQPGIHLAALMRGSPYAVIFPIAMTLAIALCFYFWLFRDKASQNVDMRVFDFHLLTIFTLWTLLVAYHRLYDALLILVLIVLFYKSVFQVDVWGLSSKMRTALTVGGGIGLALMIIPARIVDMIVPGMYSPLTNEIPAIILLIFLSALMVLFHRFLFRVNKYI